MRGITLFIFGGVAEMEDEPPSAKAEIFMAVAGPMASILVSFVSYGIYVLGKGSGWPQSVTGIFSYLRWINLILACFNLLPAFPLDGGRVFRSILWSWKGNLRWATQIASQIGAWFGLLLIFLGILNIVRGGFVGGLWQVLIGLFLRNASQMSYQRLVMRRALEGEQVHRFMESSPVTVSPSTSVGGLVEDYIYKYHFKMFPVVDGERLLGCVSTREVKEVPREEWNQRTIG
jgi:hypothetical protein